MITWIGRFVNDVELRTVAENKKVVNSRMALRPERSGDDIFADVVSWGPTAEYIGKYYKKGFEIMFIGKLINMKQKINDNLTITTLGIQIDQVIPTFGNPKIQGQEQPEQVQSGSEKGFLE